MFDRLSPAGPFATPGHTPGHVAFHLPAHARVVGGDVLSNLFSLRPIPAFVCRRIAPKHPSITRIADLAPRTVAAADGRTGPREDGHR